MNNSPNPNTAPSITEELKPCPFCGQSGPTKVGYWPDLSGHNERVRCVCGASMNGGVTKEDQITAWNTRQSAAPQHTGLTEVERVALQAITDVRHRAAASFEEGFTGARGQAYDRAVLDCHDAVRAAIAAMQRPVCADVERVVGNVLSLNLCSLVAATEEGRGKLAVETVAKRVAAAIAAPQHTGLTDVERGVRDILSEHLPHGTDFDTAAQAIAAMQQPICTDVKRLLREARSYVEQAGLRHHDVSGLVAEIDAVLLVSNRSGVERLKGVIYRNCDPFDATAEDAQVIQEIANEMAALDTPTINEGEGQ